MCRLRQERRALACDDEIIALACMAQRSCSDSGLLGLLPRALLEQRVHEQGGIVASARLLFTTALSQPDLSEPEPQPDTLTSQSTESTDSRFWDESVSSIGWPTDSDERASLASDVNGERRVRFDSSSVSTSSENDLRAMEYSTDEPLEELLCAVLFELASSPHWTEEELTYFLNTLQPAVWASVHGIRRGPRPESTACYRLSLCTEYHGQVARAAFANYLTHGDDILGRLPGAEGVTRIPPFAFVDSNRSDLNEWEPALGGSQQSPHP